MSLLREKLFGLFDSQNSNIEIVFQFSLITTTMGRLNANRRAVACRLATRTQWRSKLAFRHPT